MKKNSAKLSQKVEYDGTQYVYLCKSILLYFFSPSKKRENEKEQYSTKGDI